MGFFVIPGGGSTTITTGGSTDGYLTTASAAATYETIAAANAAFLGAHAPVLDGYVNVDGSKTMTAPLIFGNVSSPVVAAANTAKITHDATKPVSLQASYDGYAYHDVFTGYTKILSADQTIATATLTDATNLTHTLDANSRYTVEFDGYAVAANGNGFNFGFGGTVGVSNTSIWTDLTSQDFGVFLQFYTFALGGAKAGPASVTGTNIGVRVRSLGSIETTTSGTFKYQFANASATQNLTLKRGSKLTVRKL